MGNFIPDFTTSINTPNENQWGSSHINEHESTRSTGWLREFSKEPFCTSSPNNRQSLHTEKQDNVAVILGYYNGHNFVSDQINSILNQTHKNIEIFISDDCSSTKLSLSNLKLSNNDLQKIHLGIRSNNVGFSNNFLDALKTIDNQFKYFAFSDQDDIWHKNKIARALEILSKHPKETPALYCARTIITDKTCLNELSKSSLFKKPPSFSNALVQSIAGGNTMVFNKSARDLIVQSMTMVTSHDWWCYQIVTGAGGVVYYDREPCLKYRQHSNNLFGSNYNWTARFNRLMYLFNGEFRHWNDINLVALTKNNHLLTPENQRRLNDFIQARHANLFKRIILFQRSGIYRQTFLSNLGLVFGIIINQV